MVKQDSMSQLLKFGNATSTLPWQHQHQQQQQQSFQQSAPPPTTSLRSLLNQGLSLTEAKDIKEKCGKCSATLWSNTVPVRCNRCNKGYCQKCSTVPKAWSHDISWNCDKCAKILQQSSSVKITQLPAPTNTIPSLQLPAQSWDKLTIIQWNVDGICLKLLELHDRLTQILILLPSKSLKSVKQTKLGWSKVIPPSVKNKTFLAMVFCPQRHDLQKSTLPQTNKYGNLIHLSLHIKIITDWSVQHLHSQHHNSADPLWSKHHQSISLSHNHW